MLVPQFDNKLQQNQSLQLLNSMMEHNQCGHGLGLEATYVMLHV